MAINLYTDEQLAEQIAPHIEMHTKQAAFIKQLQAEIIALREALELLRSDKINDATLLTRLKQAQDAATQIAKDNLPVKPVTGPDI
jgi:uncharacterized protein with beta-barrel porin domain